MTDHPSADRGSRTGSLAISASALVIDLNFLPERYRRRRPTLRALRPALFLLGFALLLIPLLSSWSTSRTQFRLIENALARVQTDLREYQPLADERAQLEARIESARAASSDIQAAYDTVNIQSVTWNRLVARSLATAPAGVSISQLSQTGEEVVFEGTATAYLLPSRFADQLRALDEYSEVTIQSVIRLDRTEAEMAPAGDDAETGETSPEDEIVEAPEYRFVISARLPIATEPAASPAVEAGEGS